MTPPHNPHPWLSCDVCGAGIPNYTRELPPKSRLKCPVSPEHGFLDVTEREPATHSFSPGASSTLFLIIRMWVGTWYGKKENPDTMNFEWLKDLPDPTVFRTAKELLPILRDQVAPMVDNAWDPALWVWSGGVSLARHLVGLKPLLLEQCGMEIKFLPNTVRRVFTYRWGIFDNRNRRPADM